MWRAFHSWKKSLSVEDEASLPGVVALDPAPMHRRLAKAEAVLSFADRV